MTAVAPSAAAWAPAEASVRARDGVIDTMRGLAILMVIGIHSLPRAGDSALVTAIDSALRPCVPVFLFASGYLTARAGRVPVGKRLRRALEPYSIAFIAAYVVMAASNPAMDHRPFVAVARYAFAYVFVYYYVFVYIGCTLMLWGVLQFARPGEGRDGRLVLLLALAIVVGLTFGAYLDPLLQRMGAKPSLVEELRMRDLPFWFAFVATGALVALLQGEAVLRALRYPLAGAALAAYAVYALIRIAGLGDAADYDSVAFFLYAALVCLTVLGFARNAAPLAGLGSASYFIYLWHIFVIVALRQVGVLQMHPLAATVVEYAAALLVSIALVFALRRLAPPRLAQALGV